MGGVDAVAISEGTAVAAGYSWWHPYVYLKTLCQLLCFFSRYALRYSCSAYLEKEICSAINGNF
jgi:hypothetical protein